MANADPYAALIPGNAPSPDAGSDPYAALIPGGSAAAVAPDPYSALIPKVHPSAGGFPTLNNSTDVLSQPNLSDMSNIPGAEGMPSVPPVSTMSPEDKAFVDKIQYAPEGDLAVLSKAWEGAKAGFGADQLGFSKENMIKYPALYRTWQPLVAWLDLAARTPGAVIGAAQGGIGEAYSRSGAENYLPPEMSAPRLTRDIGVLGNVGIAEAMLRDPGHAAALRAKPPEVPGVETSQFLNEAAAIDPAARARAQADELLKTGGGYLGPRRLGGPEGAVPPGPPTPPTTPFDEAFGSLKPEGGVAPPEAPKPATAAPTDVLSTFYGDTKPPTEMGLGVEHPNAPPVDIGFGYTIQHGNFPEGKFGLVDDTGKIIASSNDFGELSRRSAMFLDTGEMPLAPKPLWNQDSVARGFLNGLGHPDSEIDAEAPKYGGIVEMAKAAGMRDWGITPPSNTPKNPSTTPDTFIPPEVVDFISKKLPPLSADNLSPSKEDIYVNPKTNNKRIRGILSTKFYGNLSDLPDITIKEMLQNSFDATKVMITKGGMQEGNIDITTDSKKRTITFKDDGTGMTPEVLSGPFLDIAGTHKEGEQASGGLGIAKLVAVYAQQRIDVITLRDGVVSRLSATGKELTDAIDEGKTLRIQTNKATPTDLALFPKGHGTIITAKLPEGYVDPDTAETRTIDFPTSKYGQTVLEHSPLFSNIHVRFNGEPLNNVGVKFPFEDYRAIPTIKSSWGSAHIYISREKPANSWDQKVHVLSNGIWQFDFNLPLDPNKPYGDRVPRAIYVDMASKVKPEEMGYPFAPNRQAFSPTVKAGMGQVFNHISRLFRFENLKESAKSFGDMHYLTRNSLNNKVERSGKIEITPQVVAPTMSPLHIVKFNEPMEIVNGRLVVRGRTLPELTPEDFTKEMPDVEELIVPQSEIRVDQVILHDNTVVEMSDVQSQSVSRLAHERFGQRFDDFMHEIGMSFMELRNQVARLVPGYAEMKHEAVGISFDAGSSIDPNDRGYRGVNIKIPYDAMFVNPATPETVTRLQGPVGIIMTMLHEMGHHNHRSEDGLAPHIQKIATFLDTAPDFDFHAFKQRFVSLFSQNWDIFEYINGFFTGAFNVRASGRSLKDSGSNEARNGNGSSTGAQTLYQGTGEPGVPQPSGARPSGPSTESRRGVGNSHTSERGGASFDAQWAANRRLLQAIDPGLEAPPPQPEVDQILQGVSAVFDNAPPPVVKQMRVYADHMNWLYKWAYGIDRLADLNPRFAPLLRYNERDRESRLDTSKIHDAGLRIAKAWRHLGNRSENLVALIDDIMLMNYRTPQEVAKGIVRHPTKDEFQKLVATHKVDDAALQVFASVKKFFSTFLELVTQNAREAAQRTIQDPVALAKKLDAINAQKANLEARPYFPATRFGTHFVTIRNVAGDVLAFHTFERKGLVSAEAQQQRFKKAATKTLKLGETITDGILPETAAPFVGLPPELLESIMKELNLTDDQKAALDQIRYQFAPAASFVHHFQQKSYTPGYSHDFLRAFSRYAFHGGRYYGRVKYAWALRDEIKAARAVPGNKAGAIANYMENHLQNVILDAKGDFAAFKGAIFLWVFGYSPVGAFINLSQIPMISYPFLAAKFGGAGLGDARAVDALERAMTNHKNFWKKGSYDNQTDFEMRALSYGIKTGRISEAMASQLAGMAQGENLLGLGKSKIGRGFQLFMEKAAWLFEMAEQFNRRVTYAAGLDLGMKYPNALGVKEALVKYSDEFIQLQASGFTAAEAKAVVAAVHATEQTQFVYARSTRPRFMHGRLAGTIFVFKTYLLNVLQLMGANKSSVMPRWIIMMLLLGGVMGLPGAEDAADIAKILGKWLFGKDFDPKLALRQFILYIGNEKIPPDLVLNGLARRGFGLPALADMMGQNPGRGLGGVPDSPATKLAYQQYVAGTQQRAGIPLSYEAFRKQHSQNVPVPSFDLSRSLGMGRLLPFDLGKLADPGNDPNQAIAGTAQQASGAIFSVGFNLYRALQDTSTPASDWKRWEKAMPRALASASRAYRAFDEGRERSKGGPAGAPTVTSYDVRDPEQMAEVIGMGLGFTPTKQNEQWDSIIALAETKKKFQVERQILEKQLFEAQAGQNKEEISRVIVAIKDWNKGLPQWARGFALTNQGLKSSLQEQFKTKAYREAGVGLTKAEQPLAKYIQGLFPESVVDVRPLKR